MDKLTIDSPMIVEIKSLLESARKNVAQQVNTELLTTYWQNMENRQCENSQRCYLLHLEKAFQWPIFRLCGDFTRLIKFNRQCLLN